LGQVPAGASSYERGGVAALQTGLGG
jgi:hypothetical protein